MRLAVSLAMVFVVAYIAVTLHGPAAGGERAMIGLSVGLLMLGAWLCGALFDRVRLPKITGYLLVGVIAGPFVLNLVTREQAPNLRFASDLAVALIALTAGGEIKLAWLRQRAKALATMLAVDTVLTVSVVVAVMALAAPLIPFMRGEAMSAVLVIAVLGAVVMISNSPTVIIAMISEYRAAGPLTQMILAFAVCKDLVLIVLFATAMSIGRGVVDPATPINAMFILSVGAQLLGSIALGAAIGVAMAWYVERVRAHLELFVIGCCMAIAYCGDQKFEIGGNVAHLEPLLMALSAGLLMQNLWPTYSEPLFHTIERMSLPVYCLFFAVAGVKIDLNAFATLGLIAAALVAVRAAAVWAGISLGLRAAGIDEPWRRLLWLGLIPQAGVSLVLVALIDRGFRDMGWGADLGSMLIAMIVIHETLGPIGFRYALFSSGEAGKADRPDAKTAH